MANRLRFFWLTGTIAALTLASAPGCGSDDDPPATGGKGGGAGKGGSGGAKAGTGGGGGTAGKGGTGGAGGTSGAVGKGGTAGTTDGGAGKAGSDGGGTAGTDSGTAGTDSGTAGSDSGTAGDGGGSEAATAATCAAYCASMTANCNATADQQYSGSAQCLATCSRFPAGTIGATTGNNLECRARRAALATTDKTNCDAAGPAGVSQCGTPCESYCAILPVVCPGALADAGPVADCATACAALSDVNMTNFQANQPGNTLQCRIYHLANAAENFGNEPLRTLHCGHAAGKAPCGP